MFNFTTSRTQAAELEKLIDSHKKEIQAIHDEYERKQKESDAQLEISNAYLEADKIKLEAERDADNIRLTARDGSEMTAKDSAISEASNRADRMKSEMEARIALLEDIHADEIIALEARFEAEKKSLIEVLDRKEKSLEANSQSFQNRARQDAESAKNAAIAEGRLEAAKIIQQAYVDAGHITHACFDIILTKVKDFDRNDFSEITELVKAATENYPTTNLDGLTVHSTSSSK